MYWAVTTQMTRSLRSWPQAAVTRMPLAPHSNRRKGFDPPGVRGLSSEKTHIPDGWLPSGVRRSCFWDKTPLALHRGERAIQRVEANMQRRKFLLFVTLAAAIAAPSLGQTVKPAISGTQAAVA